MQSSCPNKRPNIIVAIVIYGPQHVPFDVDLGPIMLHDWRHLSYEDVVAEVKNVRVNDILSTEVHFPTSIYSSFVLSVFDGIPLTQEQVFNLLPPSDANMINGRADLTIKCDPLYTTLISPNPNCTAAPSAPKFRFTPGKRYKLRLLNTGGDGTQKFSIDGHKLTVVAYDFTQIQPYETDVVTLGVGQRAEVIVEATGKPGDSFWMRSRISYLCLELTWQATMKAGVYYDGADTNVEPQTDKVEDDTSWCQNVSSSFSPSLVPKTRCNSN